MRIFRRKKYRNKARRAARALRRLRKHLCLCARGEPTEGDSVANEATGTATEAESISPSPVHELLERVTASSRDHEGTDHRDPRIGELSVQSEAEPVTIDSSTASEECSQSIVTPKVTVDHSESLEHTTPELKVMAANVAVESGDATIERSAEVEECSLSQDPVIPAEVVDVCQSERVVSSQEHTASDLEKMAEDLVKGVLERAMMQLATEQEACDAVKSDNVEDHRDNSAEGCVGQSESLEHTTSELKVTAANVAVENGDATIERSTEVEECSLSQDPVIPAEVVDVCQSERVVSSQEHTASDLEKMAEDLVKGVLERAMMQLATEQEACDSVKSDNVEDRRDNSAEGCVGQSESLEHTTSELKVTAANLAVESGDATIERSTEVEECSLSQDPVIPAEVVDVCQSERVVSSQEHTASDLEKMAEDLVKGVLERAMMQLATEQEACDSVKSDNVEDRRDNSAEGCVGQSESLEHTTSELKVTAANLAVESGDATIERSAEVEECSLSQDPVIPAEVVDVCQSERVVPSQEHTASDLEKTAEDLVKGVLERAMMQLATEQEARDAVKSDNVEDHRDNSDCVGQSESLEHTAPELKVTAAKVAVENGDATIERSAEVEECSLSQDPVIPAEVVDVCQSEGVVPSQEHSASDLEKMAEDLVKGVLERAMMQLAAEQEARDAVKSDNVEDRRDNSAEGCVGQSESLEHTTSELKVTVANVAVENGDATIERSTEVEECSLSQDPVIPAEVVDVCQSERVVSSQEHTASDLEKMAEDLVKGVLERAMMQLATEQEARDAVKSDNVEDCGDNSAEDCELTGVEIQESTTSTEYYSCASSVQTDNSCLFVSLPSLPSVTENDGDTGDEKEGNTCPSEHVVAVPSISSTTKNDDDSDEEEHSGGDKRRELQNSCSFDSGNVSDGEEENEDSSDSDCDGASCQSSDVPGQRSRHAVVVKLVCGVLGLGLTVGTDHLKNVVVTKIRRFSAAATHGELRVGDRILEINGLSMLGKSPSEIHAVLSKLKWGEEVNIFVFHPQETLKFQKSDTDNAGIIAVKIDAASERPPGIDIRGGADQSHNNRYVTISRIHPGSAADSCGVLRPGDQLVAVGDHLMIGITHREAVGILGAIDRPVTLTVQRKQELNIVERIKKHAYAYTD